MSGAIMGYVSFNNSNIKEELGIKMTDSLKIYKIDRVGKLNYRNVFMCCGLLNITKENENEILPFRDEKMKLIITADAIIDNRNELISELNLTRAHEIDDSTLILRAYEKWGTSCPKYIIGDFAFAIWDEVKRQLFCARDHVGKRTLYYYKDKNGIAFSTVIKPLADLFTQKVLNKSWIADFLFIDGPIAAMDMEKSVYESIFQLLPAHSMVVKDNNIIMEKYWEPLKLPKIKLKNNEEYESEFLRIYDEAVKCRLRTSKGVSVMMSGGLDSTSVACLAARELDKQGKKIKAYSSVPIKRYKNYLPEELIGNEREYIEVVNELIENLSVSYVSCEGKNVFSDTKYYLDLLEQPNKIMKNLLWLDEIARLAQKEGNGILLDGQFGNISVSFGEYSVNAVTLYRDKKYVKLLNEIKGYSKLYNIGFKDSLKYTVKLIFSDETLKRIKPKYEGEVDTQPSIPLRAEILSKYKNRERFYENNFHRVGQRMDLYETRELIMQPVQFNQIGELETKQSLMHGILRRDPTRDKRVIEFCLNIPGEQYVKNGRERVLIREAMKGILPDKIRLNYKIRGFQTADWIQRISPEWGEIKRKLCSICDNKDISYYIDINDIKRMIDEVGDEPNESHWQSMCNLLVIYMLNEFLVNN